MLRMKLYVIIIAINLYMHQN